jgi:hypothetical protein
MASHIKSEALRGQDRDGSLTVEILYSRGAKLVEVWAPERCIEASSLKVKLPDNIVQRAWLFIVVGELLNVRKVEPVVGEQDVVILHL